MSQRLEDLRWQVPLAVFGVHLLIFLPMYLLALFNKDRDRIEIPTPTLTPIVSPTPISLEAPSTPVRAKLQAQPFKLSSIPTSRIAQNTAVRLAKKNYR